MRPGGYAAHRASQARLALSRRSVLTVFAGLVFCITIWNGMHGHKATRRHIFSITDFDTEAQLHSILEKLGDFPMERFTQDGVRGHLRATFGGSKDMSSHDAARLDELQQEPGEGASELYTAHQFLMQYTQVLLCGHDATAAALLPPNGTKYLLAADFHNSAAVLPNFIVQTMRLVLLLPPGLLHVSVYESGSSDNTAHWLELLQMLLFIAGVPNSITANGDILRAPGQERIRHLATIRNAALLPLTTNSFPADYVIFTNDVFFCAEDVVRLMQHKADQACALDLKRSFYSLPPERRRQAMAQHLQQRGFVPGVLARALAANGLAYKLWKGALGGAKAVHAQLPLLLYDTWVARDMSGRRLQRSAPYSQDQGGAFRLRQGLPLRMYCCWNGLSLLRAQPFRQGLRLRAHQPRECPSSECSLLCDDLQRLGHHDIVLDPSVRVAYNFEDALDLYSGAVEALDVSSWDNTVTHTPWRDLRAQQPRRQECCALRLGHDEVDFEHDCSWYRSYDTNFTTAALAGLAT